MTIEAAYLQFVNMVNRNLTNNNISVDKLRFILLFNDISNRYVEWVLDKRNEDEIRYISKLLVLDNPLTFGSSTATFSNYKLPKNYFDLANLSVYASKNDCKDQRLFTFEIKSEDSEELYQDSNNRPSFEWRETFFLTNNNQVSVYKTDFSIDKVLLSYYRYPQQVDISGYIHPNGATSTSIDPEFDDKVVNRILIFMSKEFAAINGDAQGYQVNKDRGFAEV